MRKRTGSLIGAGAMALSLLTGGAAGALSEPAPGPDVPEQTPPTEPELLLEDHPECVEDWTPTAEELAEINAQTAKEVEALMDVYDDLYDLDELGDADMFETPPMLEESIGR